MRRKIFEVRTVARRIFRLIRQPVFLLFSVLGNGLIVLGAVVFHWFEFGRNAGVTSFLDSLYWAVAIVTTVGDSPLAPVTKAGKVLGMIMMMGGSLFLWSYMALIVSGLISPELSLLETEVREIESDLSRLQRPHEDFE